MICPLRERTQRSRDWFRMITQCSPAATTVLLVEDDCLVRDCAAHALSEAGFKVLEAGNGPDALVLLEGAHVDVVFTDINMPGDFDGLGLARRVRRRWPEIAIVITSGRGCPDIGIEGARFVPKPYMPDTVARLLGDIAGGRCERAARSRLGCLAS